MSMLWYRFVGRGQEGEIQEEGPEWLFCSRVWNLKLRHWWWLHQEFSHCCIVFLNQLPSMWFVLLSNYFMPVTLLHWHCCCLNNMPFTRITSSFIISLMFVFRLSFFSDFFVHWILYSCTVCHHSSCASASDWFWSDGWSDYASHSQLSFYPSPPCVYVVVICY